MGRQAYSSSEVSTSVCKLQLGEVMHQLSHLNCSFFVQADIL